MPFDFIPDEPIAVKNKFDFVPDNQEVPQPPQPPLVDFLKAPNFQVSVPAAGPMFGEPIAAGSFPIIKPAQTKQGDYWDQYAGIDTRLRGLMGQWGEAEMSPDPELSARASAMLKELPHMAYAEKKALRDKYVAEGLDLPSLGEDQPTTFKEAIRVPYMEDVSKALTGKPIAQNIPSQSELETLGVPKFAASPISGLVKSAYETLSGFTTPENIAIMGTVGKIPGANKIALPYFAATSGKQALESTRDAMRKALSGDFSSDFWRDVGTATASGIIAKGATEGARAEFDPKFRLANVIDNTKLNPDVATPTPAPMRELGVEYPPNAFFQPGVRDIASRALNEAQNRAVLIPGERPALAELRAEVNPPKFDFVPDAIKPEPLGGQISFNASVEAGAVPNARQSANERIPNATEIRQQPENSQQQHSGTPLGENLLQNQAEVRSEGSQPSGNSNSNVKGGVEPAVTPYKLGEVKPSEIASMPEPDFVNRFVGNNKVSLTMDATAWAMEHPNADVKLLEKMRDEALKRSLDSLDKGEYATDRSQWFGDVIHALNKDEVGLHNIESRNKLAESPQPASQSPVTPKGALATESPAATVEPATTKTATGLEVVKPTDIITKLESLKFGEEPGRLYSLPHPDAIASIGKAAWNTAIDVAIVSIKAGKKVSDAINDAIGYLKLNAKGYDEKQIRANLESIISKEMENKPGVARVGKQSTSGSSVLPSKSVSDVKPVKTLADVDLIFEPEPKQSGSLKSNAIHAIEAFRTGFSSKFRPLNKLAQDIAKAYGGTAKDVAGIFEQLKGSSGKAEADIYRFDRDVSDAVKGSEQDFNRYVFLRRTIDRLNQDLKDIQAAQAGKDVKQLNRRAVSDFTIPEAQGLLDQLTAKLGTEKTDQLEKASDLYQHHLDKALQLQVESGRMSKEVYDSIKSGNQFYAPFKVMKYLEESMRPEGTGRRVDTTADFTKAMVGIEDGSFKLGDMLAAARQSIALSRILADKNVAMKNISDLAAFDTEGLFTKKLKPDEQAPKGMEPVNVFENGEKVRYAVNPDIAQAIQTMGPQSGYVLARWFGNIFRAGATSLNVPFQISNLMADIPRQALVSKYGIRGSSDIVRYPVDLVHALYSSMMGDVVGSRNKLFMDFLDSGVAGTTIQEYLTPNTLRRTAEGSLAAPKSVVKSVLMSIPNFAAAIEQTSKILGVKRAMRFEGVESGKELSKQIPDAITELRRFSGSPDFGRIGKWTDQYRLNLLYMFLNARIQGAVADVGRLTGRDGASTAAKTWIKVGTAIGLPTAYLYFLNNSPQYKEDYDKRPDNEKRNYWMIPKDTFIKNEQGESMRDYWKIPKRESSQWMANMVESGLDFAAKKDPETLSKFAVGMMENISPVNIQGKTTQERMESVAASLNPLVKTPLEVGTGRDFYLHNPIVPDTMKKASPEQQYTKRTPDIFKKLADVMPDVAPEVFRSPLMLENMTKNLTAGLVTQFLPRKQIEGRSATENNPLLQRFQAVPYTDSSAFDEKISKFERDSTDDQLKRFRTADKLMEDNKGKSLADIAKAAPKDEKIIRRIADLWVAEKNGINSNERRILSLPTKQRGEYLAGELSDMTPDQKKDAIKSWAKKRILTEEVAYEMYRAMKQNNETITQE
jgi:hypothetical protein